MRVIQYFFDYLDQETYSLLKKQRFRKTIWNEDIQVLIEAYKTLLLKIPSIKSLTRLDCDIFIHLFENKYFMDINSCIIDSRYFELKLHIENRINEASIEDDSNTSKIYYSVSELKSDSKLLQKSAERKKLMLEQSASKRNHSMELSIEDIKKLLTTSRCYYTNCRFSENSEYYQTFDRKNNKIGYTRENTVVCIHKINQLKNMLFENEKSSIRLSVRQLRLFSNKMLKI